MERFTFNPHLMDNVLSRPFPPENGTQSNESNVRRSEMKIGNSFVSTTKSTITVDSRQHDITGSPRLHVFGSIPRGQRSTEKHERMSTEMAGLSTSSQGARRGVNPEAETSSCVHRGYNLSTMNQVKSSGTVGLKEQTTKHPTSSLSHHHYMSPSFVDNLSSNNALSHRRHVTSTESQFSSDIFRYTS